MSRVVLVAETGSDICPELAQKHNIHLVPMHVTFGDETLDDGAFPPEEVCNYYDRTGTLPKTSGCSPEDFEKVFAAIHAAHPDAHILHLAYSAATTVSYQSAKIAAEGLDYVTQSYGKFGYRPQIRHKCRKKRKKPGNLQKCRLPGHQFDMVR